MKLAGYFRTLDRHFLHDDIRGRPEKRASNEQSSACSAGADPPDLCPASCSVKGSPTHV